MYADVVRKLHLEILRESRKSVHISVESLDLVGIKFVIIILWGLNWVESEGM